MKVNNKVIVVTGGGNGMGREVTLNLLSKGAKVFAIDINEAALQETSQLAGDKKANLATAVLNITDKEAVEALPAKVIERFGAVDGLINNAGIIQPFVRLKDLKYEAIDRVLDVNLYGTLYMLKAFLPHFLTRPVAHIANVSSMGGFLPVPGQTVYGASKAAVKLMTEGLYAELLETNVKVTLVYPGAIGTNITTNSGVATPGGEKRSTEEQKFKPLAADKAAEIIVDAIEKDRYSVHVGSDAKMMDFLTRLNPKMAAGFIYKQMKSLLPA
ncbi:MAG: SDR family NAD(P)-dependent oxidoreductase [Anaerolineales bacterium]|jgi:NADP-dependent 3-hydroxy acid dehydrogenase YdfG|nr:SDR family NAD(P)-dependent oxidoreductase [Anaerolineales bacterium]